MRRDVKVKVLTREQVREHLSRAGITLRQWASSRGYRVEVLEDLLQGRTKGTRGASHNVAVLLGMKDGTINPAHSPEARGEGGTK